MSSLNWMNSLMESKMRERKEKKKIILTIKYCCTHEKNAKKTSQWTSTEMTAIESRNGLSKFVFLLFLFFFVHFDCVWLGGWTK